MQIGFSIFEGNIFAENIFAENIFGYAKNRVNRPTGAVVRKGDERIEKECEILAFRRDASVRRFWHLAYCEEMLGNANRI
jgi:hypothetical protein